MTVYFAKYGCVPQGDVCVAHDEPLVCAHCCESGDQHDCVEVLKQERDYERDRVVIYSETLYGKLVESQTETAFWRNAVKNSQHYTPFGLCAWGSTGIFNNGEIEQGCDDRCLWLKAQ